jgi:hypothetical protein
MLKIWLTWLQPSLGILGVLLVISNAISAQAASIATRSDANKVSNGHSPQKTGKSTVPAPVAQQQRVPAVSSGLASVTPDVAVRQLALDTIAISESKSPSIASKAPLARVILPSTGIGSIGANSTRAEFVNNPVATVTSTPRFPSAPIVAGLFIGNSSGSASSQFGSPSPAVVPVAKSITVPTPTATVTAEAITAEPFPAMRPEQMAKADLTPSVATQTAPQSSSQVNNIQNFLGNEPNRTQTAGTLDTTVASGLQNILGSEAKTIPTDSVAPIARSIPGTTDSISALSQLVAPAAKTAPTNTSGASLQLATSRSYDSAAQFDLPGVATQQAAVKPAQMTAKVVADKSVRTNLAKTVIQRKSDFVALMSDKPLESESHQSLATVSHSNSLGGLILGSRTNEIASLPMKVLKAKNVDGLGVFNPANQY